MTTLPAHRAELAALVGAGAGVTAHDHMPARLGVPCAFLTAGDPWLEAGPTFGGTTARWVVTLAVQPGEAAQGDLDALVTGAATALADAGVTVERVGGPYRLAQGTAEYLAANLTTTDLITLTTD